MPIVFTTGGDPIKDGFVTSLNRPTGNVTGVTFLSAVLGAKRLELLRLLVPKATTIGCSPIQTVLSPKQSEETC